MRRSTIVYIALFAIVLGAAYYFNNRSAASDAEATPEPTTAIEYLFTSTDGLPTGIRIESKAGEAVEVARDAENAWAVILPEEAAADQGSVEAAASQASTIRILDRVPGLAPSEVGLDDPEYRMILQFTSGVERTVEIGVLTPTGQGYYARGENNEILIISNSAVDALISLLTNPPYAPTETASPATP